MACDGHSVDMIDLLIAKGCNIRSKSKVNFFARVQLERGNEVFREETEPWQWQAVMEILRLLKS